MPPFPARKPFSSLSAASMTPPPTQDGPVELVETAPVPVPRAIPTRRLPTLSHLLKSETPNGSGKKVRRAKVGLRTNQLLFLEALYVANGPLTRHQMCVRTGCHPTNVTANALGRIDLESRRRLDTINGYPCLLTLEYVTMDELEIEGVMETVYHLSPSGREAYTSYLIARGIDPRSVEAEVEA